MQPKFDDKPKIKQTYELKEPRTEGNQIVYEIVPQLHESIGNGIADELNARFPNCIDRFGFLAKVAIDKDGKSVRFHDLGFNVSVPQSERQEVLDWVRERLKTI